MPPRVDGKTYIYSAFAGEMLVAAELSRLGYEVLLGNVGIRRTVGVDLAAVDVATGQATAISVKSLKNANVSILCNAALPPKYIAEQLGHASIKTTVDLYEPSSRQRRPCGNSIGSSQA
jgi:hypothetical protein